MSLVDHCSLPCPAHLVDAEVAFLTSAFACLGITELVRPVDSVVGLGRSATGKIVEDDGTNNAFLWVFGAAPSAGDGQGESVSRVHLALKAKSREVVHEFYDAALKAGGRDNGAPGERYYHKGYYGAFVLSPAGHNIEVVIRGEDLE